MANQCKKPQGWLGRLMLRNMNARHSKLTDWGLSHIQVHPAGTILDIGCGGGRTIAKLAAHASEGKIFGIDHSEASVATSTRTNAALIRAGRIEIRQGSVSELPYPDATFNLATAVETHFFWPNLSGDVREIHRVLKPGGTLVLIAEIYRGAPTPVSRLAEKYLPISGIKLLTVDEHHQLLEQAGFSSVKVDTNPSRGWICVFGAR
jgi:ubiquinone/menaquinone biosynthesis C-methylase UbiE